jgi:hypothetical protein
MFVDDFNDDVYIINEEVIDFAFLDNFMFGEDVVMQQMLRMEVARDENACEVRFIPNEEIRNRYIEENERMNRDDKRWNEDIIRDDLIINMEASINIMIENLAGLASKANEVAVSNIIWNVNEPICSVEPYFRKYNCWLEGNSFYSVQ